MATTCIVTVENNIIVSADSNYQGFRYNVPINSCTPTNKRCLRKWETLKHIFPVLVRDRTFLDIGASFGFFVFKALECGAKGAVGIEGNRPYFDAVVSAVSQLGCEDGPLVRFGYVLDRWPSKADYAADVVMAISMVHHLYNAMGSFEEILDGFKQTAGQYVLVEFIGPEDKQAQREGLDEHPDYTLENFLWAAKGLFRTINFIGKGHHDTRDIYLMEK